MRNNMFLAFAIVASAAIWFGKGFGFGRMEGERAASAAKEAEACARSGLRSSRTQRIF